VTERNARPHSLADKLEAQEKESVFFVGCIIHAKAEGKESSNCQLIAAKDHYVHVYVRDGPDDDATSSAIVEVTPRQRKATPAWSASNLNRVSERLASRDSWFRNSGASPQLISMRNTSSDAGGCATSGSSALI
jgi:hypothetical protein